MLRPRRHIRKLEAGYHGGIDYRELERLGLKAPEVLDFSVSTNPFGPPPGLHQALAEAVVERYPDSNCGELKALLARKLSISTGHLIIGSGSTELIRLAVSAYLGSDDRVLWSVPTYGDYEVACRWADAEIHKLVLTEENDFRLNVNNLLEEIARYRPKGIFLCNPNNPTGQYLSCEEVKSVLAAAPRSLVVLDEAYVAFSERSWNALDLAGKNNLLILRSMTKDYALAGLRLGYAVAAKPIIGVMERVRPPWNVSSPAQKAGVYALLNSSYLENCRVRTQEARQFLIEKLEEMGWKALPSQANFFLIRVGEATVLREKLLRRGILVRDCTSFGLPHYIRLAVRPVNECQRLLEVLQEIRRGAR